MSKTGQFGVNVTYIRKSIDENDLIVNSNKACFLSELRERWYLPNMGLMLNTILIFVVVVFLGSYPAVLRDYLWFCIWRSLMAVSETIWGAGD